jgi:hypothetical protein
MVAMISASTSSGTRCNHAKLEEGSLCWIDTSEELELPSFVE